MNAIKPNGFQWSTGATRHWRSQVEAAMQLHNSHRCLIQCFYQHQQFKLLDPLSLSLAFLMAKRYHFLYYTSSNYPPPSLYQHHRAVWHGRGQGDRMASGGVCWRQGCSAGGIHSRWQGKGIHEGR